MDVLILAGGYGTRLKELGENTPKPLLEIQGRPLVEYTLDLISKESGVERVVMVTNDKFYDHFNVWKSSLQQSYPFSLHILNDRTTSPEDRLGSIGDIIFAVKEFGFCDDLLVIGGDNLFDFDLKPFFTFASRQETSVTMGCYDIGPNEDASQYGVLELNPERMLISFEEKPKNPKSSLIAMCVYFFPKKTLPLLDEYRRASQSLDKAGEYIQWLYKKNNVYGFQFSGRWYDIGSIDSYQLAQQQFHR